MSAPRLRATVQRPARPKASAVVIHDPLAGVNPIVAAAVRRQVHGRWKAIDLRVVTATRVEFVTRRHTAH